jgi:hypothetical protein
MRSESFCRKTYAHTLRVNNVEGLEDDQIQLLAVAAILSTMIATPGIAQQAVQEPGLQAFYQSVGSQSRATSNAMAMASARGASHVNVPAKHTSAKRYANPH